MRLRAIALFLLLTSGCGGVLAFGGAAVMGGGLGYARGKDGTRTKDTEIGAGLGVAAVAVIWLTGYLTFKALNAPTKSGCNSWGTMGCGQSKLILPGLPGRRTRPQ